MKHNYEKKNSILILTIILVVIELISFIYINEKKVFCYEKITGLIVDKNQVLITPNKSSRKLIYQNNKVYIKDNAISYEIIEDKGLISEKYYQILLKMKTPSTKEQIVELSVKEKKQNILSTFKSLWKEEIN